MLSRSQVSAVIVTRGDHSLEPIWGTLDGFAERIIWDNSKKRDTRVFGRYLAAQTAFCDYVYVQDDDCMVGDIERLLLLAGDNPGNLVTNMPVEYRAGYFGTGISLVGFGAVFPQSFIGVFNTYYDYCPDDELFTRECDRVFTYLNRHRTLWVDVPFHHLPHATAPDRMYREPRHGDDLKAIKARLAQLPQPSQPQGMPAVAVEL